MLFKKKSAKENGSAKAASAPRNKQTGVHAHGELAADAANPPSASMKAKHRSAAQSGHAKAMKP